MFGLICPIVKGKYNKFIKTLNNNSAIIKIKGITHIVIEDNSIIKKYNKDELKNYSYKILKDNNLLNKKAAGVLYINSIDNNTIEIIPIVYVKRINTLFFETACGSGTLAVGIYISYNRKESVNLSILQPSKEIIKVETIADYIKLYNARISGKVIEYNKIKNI